MSSKARKQTCRPLDRNDLSEGDVLTAMRSPDGAPWKAGDKFRFVRVLPGGEYVALDPLGKHPVPGLDGAHFFLRSADVRHFAK